MLGEEIRKPPPTEDVIVDSSLKPVVIVETDPAGRFEFQRVAKGRYSIVVESRLRSRGIEPPCLRSGRNAVVFDVGSDPRVDVGTVNPPNEP
jgi:hypothetical protein